MYIISHSSFFYPTTLGFLVDNGEFFIRSSGSPFTFTRSSFSASDFFPGGSHSSDYDVLFSGSAQTPGVPYPPPSKATEAQEETEEQIIYPSEQGQHSEEDQQAVNASQEEGDQQQVGGGGASLGQLRHTRDKLRLEIPSMSISGDSTVAESSGLENGGDLDFSDQNNFVLMNHSSRVEPEVSEV